MSRAKKIGMGVGGALVLVMVAALVYLFVIREEAEPELVLGETRATEEPPATDPPDTAGPATTSAPATTGSGPDSLDGRWEADPLSVAGYRVIEDFRGIPDFEAVGRTTTPIIGEMTIDGTTVSEATFRVTVADIESPESLRDGQFRRVMGTDEFPTAVFSLTGPLELGAVPADGAPITVRATGDLTLRDVTRSVTFDITAQRNGATIETLSQIPVVFSDHGIDTPSAPGITVQDDGLLEASIIFIRSQ